MKFWVKRERWVCPKGHVIWDIFAYKSIGKAGILRAKDMVRCSHGCGKCRLSDSGSPEQTEALVVWAERKARS